MEKKYANNIPISVSLEDALAQEDTVRLETTNKHRLIYISILAVLIALFISVIAKFLVYLIYLITNLSFYGNFSIVNNSPANNHLGIYVIFIPALGGILVGLMAYFGSKAIRGHGIPEAMEQILTNKSKIKPTITYLKPISSAISIGTGGPFGAEGPIIATGGALGSTIGQVLKISNHERKILLAAGATAGMSAIFNSPIAAIFLAIELLLFEFSPRSIIPVALACITGAAGHHLFFENHPVFELANGITINTPSNMALLIYSVMGILIGLLSVGITKLVYLIEDYFEKLPIHWMWWPAIGGVAVGVIGYFAPRTLGVGYNNITDILSGSITIQAIIFLCLMKFISWVIALGSGTSGGTLAPLLTIGSAIGTIMGSIILTYFPNSGLSLSLSAIVGMAALFAGASRAFLTSIIFALETTGQSNALLPLLATCGASYFVSFFTMENTLMTEKIARRGVKTPDSYEPDILEKITAEQAMDDKGVILNGDDTIEEVLAWLEQETAYQNEYYIIADNEGKYCGIIASAQLYDRKNNISTTLDKLNFQCNDYIENNQSLKQAVLLMSNENTMVLPVLQHNTQQIIGTLSYHNILNTYKINIDDYKKNSTPPISLKRRGLVLLIQGKKMIKLIKPNI